MATAPSTPVQNGAIAEGAAAVAFMLFITLFLAAGAAVAGALTVQGILGGVAIPRATVWFSVLAIAFLILGGICGLLAAVFAP